MFNDLGFQLHENVLPLDWRIKILDELEGIELPPTSGGIRNADQRFTSINRLCHSDILKHLVISYLSEAQLVRAILFVKSSDNNWRVNWHQDKTVTLSNKFEAPGWTNWTRKDQILHVQPPFEVLESTITLRIHLDNSTKENGCLQIIPESHKKGLMSDAQISDCVLNANPFFCEGKAGSILAMKPHLVHRSSKSESSMPRRVLHVEFSDYKLPKGLSWR